MLQCGCASCRRAYHGCASINRASFTAGLVERILYATRTYLVRARVLYGERVLSETLSRIQAASPQAQPEDAEQPVRSSTRGL